MKSSLKLLLCFWWLLVVRVNAQPPTATLTGTVIDAKTERPLPFASVFLNNSTRGTTADENGNYRLTNIPLGTHEVVASMLGHTTARQTIRLSEARTYTIPLKLESNGTELTAVSVTARRSGLWQRQVKQFTRELLGKQPPARQTRIVNTDALRFNEEKGHLLAQATEPLVIENNALGYRLHYTLLHFDLYRGRMDFAGDCRFEEMTPANVRQQASWQANRLKAYHSSLHHLLASLLTGSHEQEGFTVYQTPLAVDGNQGGTLALPLVRTGERTQLGSTQAMALFQPGQMPFERRLVSNYPLEVYYNRVYTNNSPYRDLPYAYSMLLLPNGSCELTTNGWVTQGNGLDVRGFLGDDRLTTLLPADWVPVDKQQLEAADILTGRTLRPEARLDSLLKDRQRQVSRTAPVVFVHTDKTLYSTGDVVWLSAYVLDATRQLPLEGRTDKPLQVELLAPDGQSIHHQWLRIDEGRTVGQLRLSDTLRAGTYRLRAYTAQDQPANGPAFETLLTVGNIRQPGRSPEGHREPASLSGRAAGASRGVDSVDVQFLPEGGRWLAGVPGRLGVRAVQPGGRGKAVGGRIVDQTGQEVARFSTNALGLGQVALTPQPSQQYVALLDTSPGVASRRVPLPTVESEGWALSVDALSDSARLLVTARATGRYGQPPVYITLQSREQLVYRQKWQLQKGEAQFALPVLGLPPGVCRLTLWDTSGRARAERLVFVVERNGAVQMRVTAGKPRYAPREQVAIGLQFRDPENYPVASIWSAAVTDADQVPADTNQPDLRTHVLLTSGLGGGRIESPAHYLLPENVGDLDLLLLTRGWRRLPAPTPADSLGGWTLSGHVQDSRGRPLANEKVMLWLENKGLKLQRGLTTDGDGRFQIPDLLLADTVQLRASTPKAKNTVIRFDRPGGVFTSDPIPTPDWDALSRWTADAGVRQTEWPALYRDSTARQLAEVIVRAAKLDNERPVEVERASLHGSADAVFIPPPGVVYEHMGDMLSRIPQYSTLKNRNTGTGARPLILVDGLYQESDVLESLSPTDVARIELLWNAGQTSMYGARGAGGILAIYTKKGSRDATSSMPKVPAVMLMGFAPPREYYVPRYELPEVANHTDRRDVLYWQPLGRSDVNGLGRLVFPLNDVTRRLRVSVQGLSTEGVPIHFNWVIPVR